MIWQIPYRRATILIPSGPTHDPDRKHLFIILTDPCPTAGDVLMVNVSTVRPGHDPACRLFVGDHAFIRRESFVEYAMARVELAQKISDSVANRVLVPCADLDSAIFARVCHGLTISQFIKPRFLTYYHDHTGL